MKTEDQQQLFTRIKQELATSGTKTFAIIGHTPDAYDILAFFRSLGVINRIIGVYDTETTPVLECIKPMERLAIDCPSVAILASDEDKETLLQEAHSYLPAATTVLIAGFGHFRFQDPIFESAICNPLVPSLANGYPNSLIHIFQCLKNAAQLGLSGVVIEFGMFKGGTTMLLSQFIERLGQQWPVIGFDTFAGFPARRSALDMYSHPDCVFPDEQAVRRYVQGRNIEVVSGDIVTTAKRVADEQVVVAFVDTDNYTSACAVLDAIQDRVVIGGAIVFDHFTGRNRFLYTLGERLAAKRLLNDSRYFHLYDTGVFIRQR